MNEVTGLAGFADFFRGYANIIRHVGPAKGGRWEIIANTSETQGE